MGYLWSSTFDLWSNDLHFPDFVLGYLCPRWRQGREQQDSPPPHPTLKHYPLIIHVWVQRLPDLSLFTKLNSQSLEDAQAV